MKKYILGLLLPVFFISSQCAQSISDLKLKEGGDHISNYMLNNNIEKPTIVTKDQIPTRKTVGIYFGAGYSFVIFLNSTMNTGYPVLDTRSGDFLSEINLFFGFSIAKAVTLEFEPSILFTRNNRNDMIQLSTPYNLYGQNYNYDFPSTQSMLAFPLVVNARFFPLFKTKGFMRLFFVGAGAGATWIREEYDHNFTTQPYYYGGYFDTNVYSPTYTSSTSQWEPVLRVITGFTGTGGMFGYGGELRFNFIPLKSNNDPFRTRMSKNFNSIDLAFRIYFSL